MNYANGNNILIILSLTKFLNPVRVRYRTWQFEFVHLISQPYELSSVISRTTNH